MWWLDQLSKGSIFKFKSLSGCCKAMVSTFFFLLFTLYKHTSERSMSPTFEYPLEKCSYMTVKSVSPARDTQSSNASQCNSETAASSVVFLSCCANGSPFAQYDSSPLSYHNYSIWPQCQPSCWRCKKEKTLNMMRLFFTFSLPTSVVLSIRPTPSRHLMIRKQLMQLLCKGNYNRIILVTC